MPSELVIVIERLGLATVAGSAIGLNRKLHGKPVGIRTHSLVALGSATFVYVSYGGALYPFKSVAQLKSDGYGGTPSLPVPNTGHLTVELPYSGS